MTSTGNREGENAAVARLTLDPNLAIMGADNLAANEQTETEAAGPAEPASDESQVSPEAEVAEPEEVPAGVPVEQPEEES